MHGIKVPMAKNYIDNLSEETCKGMTEKAQPGIWRSYAPFGFGTCSATTGRRPSSRTRSWRLWSAGSSSGTRPGSGRCVRLPDSPDSMVWPFAKAAIPCLRAAFTTRFATQSTWETLTGKVSDTVERTSLSAAASYGTRRKRRDGSVRSRVHACAVPVRLPSNPAGRHLAGFLRHAGCRSSRPPKRRQGIFPIRTAVYPAVAYAHHPYPSAVFR